MHHNGIADELFAHQNQLVATNARLACSDAKDNQQLQQLISNAASAAAGHGVSPGGTLQTGNFGNGMKITVSPFCFSRPGAIDDVISCAVVMINQPETSQQNATQILSQQYGLTATEAEIALLMSSGLTATQVSEKRHVSIRTTRTQIHHIYQKIGVNNQLSLLSSIQNCLTSQT